MRHQVEHPRRKGAHSNCCNHKTQLADGGICQDFLDIKLPDRDRGSEEGCQTPHQGNGVLRQGYRRYKG